MKQKSLLPMAKGPGPGPGPMCPAQHNLACFYTSSHTSTLISQMLIVQMRIFLQIYNMFTPIRIFLHEYIYFRYISHMFAYIHCAS